MTQNKSKLIGKLLLLLVLSFSTQAFGQQTNPVISTEEAVTESVKLVPCKREERFEAVKKLFAQMGAKDDAITVEKFNKDKISNVVVKKKGKTDETIVIGAHYDRVDEGCGVVDNWTGIVILAHLFKTLNQIDTQKSYVFVAFDQEEKGLLGSDEMAKAIPKENRPQYCSMVNLDSFGTGAPMALQNASSPKMISLAKKLAEDSKFRFIDIAVGGANADSSSFKNRDIPAITMSGLDNQWMTYMHSKNDQLAKINMKSVYFSYRFALMYVANLDSTGCQEYK
jgi:Zn-dependent M28 family amino/carboxypeptidase